MTWVTGDAADTGLPSGSFDAAVSNMGIIFVEPAKQVAEIARLLKPQGVLGFSSWVREPGNPFFRPVLEVLGPPQDSGYSPDQWGEPDTVADRLAADFDDLAIESRFHTWQLGSLDDAMKLGDARIPYPRVDAGRIDDDTTRERLRAGFEDEFRRCLDADGTVTYDAPYVVVTALRR